MHEGGRFVRLPGENHEGSRLRGENESKRALVDQRDAPEIAGLSRGERRTDEIAMGRVVVSVREPVRAALWNNCRERIDPAHESLTVDHAPRDGERVGNVLEAELQSPLDELPLTRGARHAEARESERGEEAGTSHRALQFFQMNLRGG